MGISHFPKPGSPVDRRFELLYPFMIKYILVKVGLWVEYLLIF